ncbi:hypothetical protein SAY87_009888 [Trapa incisa]|uniref:Tricalbin-3-like n=1 Tax=Trapa incisa TaxID=236973 RepID=A0AAN7JYD1_9MYRT|nr:hypothetical protein SAY87_009888 [Trapa incisa]
MILQSSPSSSPSYVSSFRFTFSLSSLCPCGGEPRFVSVSNSNSFSSRNRGKCFVIPTIYYSRCRWSLSACVIASSSSSGTGSPRVAQIAEPSRRAAKSFVSNNLCHELGDAAKQLGLSQEGLQVGSSFTSFQEDPIVDKLRTQLGVIHPIPSPPINRNIVGLFIFFFFVGVAFDKLWTSRKKKKKNMFEADRDGSQAAVWPQVPTSFSLFLEKDLLRKESVEWVNMVLGKLWKVYKAGIENWIIGLLQPVIDDLKKPDYVERVEIKQFSLGEEPLSVRNVERRTSRRVNDLQYQIGIRYTGGARMLLMLSLKFGIIPIVVPVGVRDFDIDGELWVKLRLIPTEPWVGAVSWAFVSLPKIKFELSPFRLFNLMAIPVLSMFLTKLLTEDLPRLFVRPKKIVLDFQKGKAVGPVTNEFKSLELQEGNKDYAGELSVTLVDARKLSYVFYGKTDPYVILSVSDQSIRSKKNSQTTVIGPPGEPIWNQDFHLLVTNPRKEKLIIQVKDSLGFADLTIGTGEVDLASLQDTVPTDRVVLLRGGWGVFRKGSSGEILLRLTYKAYVEDEEDERNMLESMDTDVSDDESDSDDTSTTYEQKKRTPTGTDKESFMDVLAALIVSEEFQGIVASETISTKILDDAFPIGSAASSSGPRGDPVSLDSYSGLGGSVLFWLAVVTSISVLISFNIGGSSFFNP